MARKKTISDADLLRVARELFVEKGLAASTREIARRAGVSEGVLFQRFATKHDLFFAAMVLPATDLKIRLRKPGSSGRKRLEEIARSLTDYFRATLPVLLPLMLHPGFGFEEFARRHPDSPLDTLRWDLVSFLSAQRKAGRLGPVDPGAAALLIFALAECIAFFERMGAHGGQFPPEVLERAMTCLWEGLGPRKRTRRYRP